MIEDVKHLQTELQFSAFRQSPILVDGEVHVVDRRTRALARPAVAKGGQLVAIPCEGFWIQPLVPRRIAEMARLAVVAQWPAGK